MKESFIECKLGLIPCSLSDWEDDNCSAYSAYFPQCNLLNSTPHYYQLQYPVLVMMIQESSVQWSHPNPRSQYNKYIIKYSTDRNQKLNVVDAACRCLSLPFRWCRWTTTTTTHGLVALPVGFISRAPVIGGILLFAMSLAVLLHAAL